MGFVIVLAMMLFITRECAYAQCITDGASCETDVMGCCKGSCVTGEYGEGMICRCKLDSWFETCSSNNDCCSGHCNSRGYCGCISSGYFCDAGHSHDCCGNNGVKTCTKGEVHFVCY